MKMKTKRIIAFSRSLVLAFAICFLLPLAASAQENTEINSLIWSDQEHSAPKPRKHYDIGAVFGEDDFRLFFARNWPLKNLSFGITYYSYILTMMQVFGKNDSLLYEGNSLGLGVGGTLRYYFMPLWFELSSNLNFPVTNMLHIFNQMGVVYASRFFNFGAFFQYVVPNEKENSYGEIGTIRRFRPLLRVSYSSNFRILNRLKIPKAPCIAIAISVPLFVAIAKHAEAMAGGQ